MARMPNIKSGEAMAYIQFFVYLQVLDLLTTLVGLKFGVGEASPFVRWLMNWGPAVGVALSKGLAVALAGFCVWMNKQHLVRWITYWYAGLIVWNLCTILVGRVP
jgi:uncharacterized protein DUF5658